ncbi:hypothetical protein [Pedobacter sp. V48]|uniref:hypothetical protein n=1 Tax=Pedobacter sp. V48 TaxID=509635 RepID=UPI0003E4AE57|nr:hypothetical protein [Pedobacter sp. V48]ETZ24633.1 hypothetical protein N824_14040 [Pedobacter sp. V48]
MDFKSYTTEDFLADESFLNYCLDNDTADRIFWEHWIIQHPNKKVEVEKATALFFILSGDWSSEQLEANYKSFQSSIQKNIEEKKITVAEEKQSANKVIQYTISAMIMTLFCSVTGHKTYQSRERFVTYPTAYSNDTHPGKKKTTFPNETKVVLNSASSLRWPSTFNRLVYANIERRGAACFEIGNCKQTQMQFE